MSNILEWKGPNRKFDLVKEGAITLGAVLALVLVASFLFRVPDEKAVTFRSWAAAAPSDFVTTAVAELNGSSDIAGYGPPYNHTPAFQKVGSFSPQKLGGVTIPVDTATDFVLAPLATMPGDAQLTKALAAYEQAPAKTQADWGTSYGDALAAAPDNNPAKVKAGNYGPVPVLSQKLLAMASNGGLDNALPAGTTNALLFIGDGGYLGTLADAQLLAGDHWGMVNSSGNFPGQFWLIGFSYWYQINPFKTSDNADVLAFGTLGLLTLLVLFLPWIPGVRAIPRRLGLHWLIWWPYYRDHRQPVKK